MKTRKTPRTLNEWQIEEIKRGLAEADLGEFASDEEVQRVLSEWTRAAENKPPN